ncbi:MAG TPA: ClpXP protease specificity-enhancing factor SspB [Methylovirgula sp.]
MATDLIRYDLLVQDALRSVVRRVLAEAARDGLPSDHHFFVSFLTQAPGVRLSSRMREQYPQEMTIVLQHQYWDLVVGEAGFEVGLSFHGKSEILAIPFTALTGFFDPSVDFGLKFEVDTGVAGAPLLAALPPGAEKPAALADPIGRSRISAADNKAKPRGSGSEPAEIDPPKTPDEAAKEPAPITGTATTLQPANEPNVVSIDAFRKKP